MSQTRTFLAGAAAMAAAITAVVTLTGAATAPTHARFDEITVGRINIEEPDGTKRLVISNRAQFPGEFEQGREVARPDRRAFAGMLFINDEGTENGGLIQKGRLAADGRHDSGLSLTFDRFRQDQALRVLHTDTDRGAASSIEINDVPSYKTTSSEDQKRFTTEAAALPPAERSAYWRRLAQEGRTAQPRVYLGTTADKASALVLNDAAGRPRMMLMVAANGDPKIQMLDETGAVVRTVSGAQ